MAAVLKKSRIYYTITLIQLYYLPFIQLNSANRFGSTHGIAIAIAFAYIVCVTCSCRQIEKSNDVISDGFGYDF